MITIQIGNSDDKLTQSQWAAFYGFVSHHIKRSGARVHFSGCSDGAMPWQNACWAIEIEQDKIPGLIHELTELRKMYHQESIAWTPGQTQFI